MDRRATHDNNQPKDNSDEKRLSKKEKSDAIQEVIVLDDDDKDQKCKKKKVPGAFEVEVCLDKQPSGHNSRGKVEGFVTDAQQAVTVVTNFQNNSNANPINLKHNYGLNKGKTPLQDDHKSIIEIKDHIVDCTAAKEDVNNQKDQLTAEKDTKEATEEKDDNDGPEKEQEVNLNDYIKELGQQDMLEQQLASRLENKESRMNRCTYNDWPIQFDPNAILCLKNNEYGDNHNVEPQDKTQIQEASNPKLNQGYLYQSIFSCRTCYEEQAKWKLIQTASELKKKYPNGQLPASLVKQQDQIQQINSSSAENQTKKKESLQELAIRFDKLTDQEQELFLEQIENLDFKNVYGLRPHGFCLGCMINCHDTHEVNELYSKLDFRCDCGNSHMQESCQLHNEKDYENILNKYNDNYYDIYCHCKTPHDQENIDNQKFYMLQCFQCEDWLHNTCLHPILCASAIDEEYIVICRKCMSSQGPQFREAVMQYQEFFYKELIEFLSDDQSKKKQDLSGIHQKDNTDQKCCKKEENLQPSSPNTDPQSQICDNGKLDEDGNVIEPSTKRQRLEENIGGADRMTVNDPFDVFVPFDVILSDKFMLSETFQMHSQPIKDEDKEMVNNPESQQNNSTNHAYLFRKINKLIMHMNNMNEEEAQIVKNLDGQVLEPGSQEAGGSSQQMIQNQQQSNQQQPKIQGGIQGALNSGENAFGQYFDLMFAKTIEKMKCQFQSQQQSQVLRTGHGAPPQGSLPISQAGQIFIAENLNIFKQKFMKLLQDVQESGKVVTKEMVQQFFQELNCIKDQRLNEHSNISNNQNTRY